MGFNGPTSMAVLVQAQIEASVSGVAFTGIDGRLAIIEVTWGSGEGLVQGWVAPDRKIGRAHV